jgi:quinol monooxygenase YgiN
MIQISILRSTRIEFPFIHASHHNKLRGNAIAAVLQTIAGEAAFFLAEYKFKMHQSGRRNRMVTVALWVRLEAKKGKEKDVEAFLKSGLSIVQAEQGTTTWFALRVGPSTYGIFDAFQDEDGRNAHLNGRVAAALKEKASELFSEPPSIEKVDVLAAKLANQASVAGA